MPFVVVVVAVVIGVGWCVAVVDSNGVHNVVVALGVDNAATCVASWCWL